MEQTDREDDVYLIPYVVDRILDDEGVIVLRIIFVNELLNWYKVTLVTKSL